MAWFTDPSLPDLGQAQEGALMSINAMQLTGRPGTHLAVSAPPHISPKGREQGARPSRPAGYAQRWPATEQGYRIDVGLHRVRRMPRAQGGAGCHGGLTRHIGKGRTTFSPARRGRRSRTITGLPQATIRAYLEVENR